MHWRFQVLVDEYPTKATRTAESVWMWCIGVQYAIQTVLGTDNEHYENMEWVRHRMTWSVDIEPRRRRRERELFGELLPAARVSLHSAAFMDRNRVTGLRLVDLHPWVAETAEPLFEDGHRKQAILAAAQNVEVRWRQLLDIPTGTLAELAQESFSAAEPNAGHPRLRFVTQASDTSTDEWRNLHIGAMDFAKGCAGRIRNLNLHHPPDREPEPEAVIETLSALSLLARWITDAEIHRAE
ncbi:TIGR02391 family protein [Candidatus Poriferisodalis multihospitum]|uniref:TIGR02391 family protein n=1 Tax=Candidatus Poriferisodalis multihospitum TaxID=2983191 RepID=UPI002B2625D6|nr:TIGR02391 family protein [Candidatus Poriferisodalis multihospitum]